MEVLLLLTTVSKVKSTLNISDKVNSFHDNWLTPSIEEDTEQILHGPCGDNVLSSTVKILNIILNILK